MVPTLSAVTDPPLRRPAAAVVAALAAVAAGDVLLSTAFEGLRQGSGGFPGWLPQLGSIGETAVFYLLLADVLKFVVVPATLIWFGYAYGRSRR